MSKKRFPMLEATLKGNLFQQNELRKHRNVIGVLAIWIVITIILSGGVDVKIYNIKKLKEQRRALKSEHVGLRSRLMNETRPSLVVEKVTPLGLEYSFEPPVILENNP